LDLGAKLTRNFLFSQNSLSTEVTRFLLFPSILLVSKELCIYLQQNKTIKGAFMA
jgi:hypothetical protein